MMTTKIIRIILLGICLGFTACMEWDYGLEEEFNASGEGLFICNE